MSFVLYGTVSQCCDATSISDGIIVVIGNLCALDIPLLLWSNPTIAYIHMKMAFCQYHSQYQIA